MGVGNKLAHTRFDNRSAARSKRLHFGATHVDPNDLVAHGSKAGSRDRAHVSQPKNANGQTQANSPDSRVIKIVTAQFELYQAHASNWSKLAAIGTIDRAILVQQTLYYQRCGEKE